jgi:hypothetical protein
MPQINDQLNNSEILGRILRSSIGVIGRRTSESYAIVAIGNIIKNLESKYDFLKYVKIKSTQFSEGFDVVELEEDINHADQEEIGKATTDIIRKITEVMGRQTGYFFIKEIKEDLPSDYELTIRELGVNLDFLQMEYITERKHTSKYEPKNSEILKHVFKTLFDILERETGRRTAVLTMRELTSRFSTEYTILRYVKINDVSSIQNIDIVTVDADVNSVDSGRVGGAVQKIIQEVNKSLGEKGGVGFIEKLKTSFNFDFIYKLDSMGVNLNVISLGHDLVIKNVLKTLVDVLSEASTQSYAILMINNVLKKTSESFDYLKNIKIDGMRYSEGIDAITIPESIGSVRTSDLGRGLQKVVENFVASLGDAAGQHFIEKFKKHLDNLAW